MHRLLGPLQLLICVVFGTQEGRANAKEYNLRSWSCTSMVSSILSSWLLLTSVGHLSQLGAFILFFLISFSILLLFLYSCERDERDRETERETVQRNSDHLRLAYFWNSLPFSWFLNLRCYYQDFPYQLCWAPFKRGTLRWYKGQNQKPLTLVI